MTQNYAQIDHVVYCGHNPAPTMCGFFSRLNKVCFWIWTAHCVCFGVGGTIGGIYTLINAENINDGVALVLMCLPGAALAIFSYALFVTGCVRYIFTGRFSLRM